MCNKNDVDDLSIPESQIAEPHLLARLYLDVFQLDL